jgi:hypothetical protein
MLECPRCGGVVAARADVDFSETAWFKVGDDVQKILESTDENLDVGGLDDEYASSAPADTETRRQYSLDHVPEAGEKK